MIQDIMNIEAHHADCLNTRNIACRLFYVFCFISSDEESLLLNGEIAHHLNNLLSLGSFEFEAVENYVPQTGKGDKSGSSDSGFEVGSDEDYIIRAAEVAVNNGQLSTTTLQMKLKLGYARASRIIDELEERVLAQVDNAVEVIRSGISADLLVHTGPEIVGIAIQGV